MPSTCCPRPRSGQELSPCRQDGGLRTHGAGWRGDSQAERPAGTDLGPPRPKRVPTLITPPLSSQSAQRKRAASLPSAPVCTLCTSCPCPTSGTPATGHPGPGERVWLPLLRRVEIKSLCSFPRRCSLLCGSQRGLGAGTNDSASAAHSVSVSAGATASECTPEAHMGVHARARTHATREETGVRNVCSVHT